MAAIVTVRLNNNATLRILCRLTLGIGSTLIYADGMGFRVINNVGELLTALVRTAATVTYPLGGSKEIGRLSASYTPVPSAQRVTIDGTLIAALAVSVRARLEMRTTDALTSVTMRVQNLTTLAIAGTSATSTATDTAYNGVNQQQAVALTIAAGSNVYELQIIGGNADTDVLGNGYLEVYVP